MAAKKRPDALSSADRRLLDAWLVTFENAWGKGRLAKQVEDLPQDNGPLRRAALRELVKIDLHRRWQTGEHVRLESYLRAYPELGTPDTVASELILAEYEARQDSGFPPEPEKLIQRFPNRVSDLRPLLHLPEDAGTPVRQRISAVAPDPRSDRRAVAEGRRTPQPVNTAPKSSLVAWLAIAGAIAGTFLLGIIVVVALAARNLGNVAAQTPVTTAPVIAAGTKPPVPDPDFENLGLAPVDDSKLMIRQEQESAVDAVGNAKSKVVVKMAPALAEVYRQMMTRQYYGGSMHEIPLQTKNVLEYLDLDATGSLLEDPKAELTPDALVLDTREICCAKHQEGRWSILLTTDPTAHYEIIKKERSRAVTVRSLQASGTILMQAVFTLPEGAHNIEVTGKPSRLVYELPAPRAPSGSGSQKPTLSLETKPHLMSALYKLYGDPRFPKMWAARSVFRNTSDETLSEYQIRFRVAGYSEWSIPLHYDQVHAGQTVVDNYQPIIDAKVRDLKGATPVDIVVEYEYVRPNGEKVRDVQTQRTKLLGFNEGVYTDVTVTRDSPWHAQVKCSPWLLASFTAGNDPVIAEVVGMLSKTTGGAAAAIKDEDATRFLKSLFDLMRCNISYETTPGSVIDGLLHQHLKYPRDVLRTKSGTCINTSIFFAGVAEAAGLESFLVVVPGHCFAAARLPQSGKLLYVETTFCGGGTMATSGSFQDACRTGAEEFQKAYQTKLFVLVNIAEMRSKGVAPPELPDAGKNALDQWKIVPPDLAVKEPPPADVARVRPGAGPINATILDVRKEPNVTRNQLKGMAFHVRARIVGARGVNCGVFVMSLDENDRPVPASLDAYSIGGTLANMALVTPGADDEELKDIVLFIPYSGTNLAPGTHNFHAVIGVVGPNGELACEKPAMVPYTINKGR